MFLELGRGSISLKNGGNGAKIHTIILVEANRNTSMQLKSFPYLLPDLLQQ